MAEQFAAFGSADYFVLLACLAVSRALDFFSTWIATPNLLLEANPIARKLGWRMAIPINVVLSLALALWPLPAVMIATSSVLVAARNFQSAWLMRTMGELPYRLWMGEQLAQGRALFFFCLAAQTAIYSALGGTLLYFSVLEAGPDPSRLISGPGVVPFGIGMGIIGFAVAVFVFTMLSVWRIARPKI